MSSLNFCVIPRRIPAAPDAGVAALGSDRTGQGVLFLKLNRAQVARSGMLVVYKTANSKLMAYVDRQDDAYASAQRRRIEAQPKTGAIQIVEVREQVE